MIINKKEYLPIHVINNLNKTKIKAYICGNTLFVNDVPAPDLGYFLIVTEGINSLYVPLDILDFSLNNPNPISLELLSEQYLDQNQIKEKYLLTVTNINGNFYIDGKPSDLKYFFSENKIFMPKAEVEKMILMTQASKDADAVIAQWLNEKIHSDLGANDSRPISDTEVLGKSK